MKSWKEIKNHNSGIYCLENIVANKKYVGQTIDFYLRERDHFRSLEKGSHYNRYLQSAYDLYGEDSFVFSVLEECPIQELDDKEILYIAEMNTRNPEIGYNMNDGGNRNGNPRDETRKLMSDNLRGKPGRRSKNAKEQRFVGIRKRTDTRWESAISNGLKQIHLGSFKTEHDAALAYDKVSLELFGKTFNFDEDYVKNTILPEKNQSSKYIGVYKRIGEINIWRPRIMYNRESVNIGSCKTEILAAQNYDLFTLDYRDWDSKLNFPELLPIYKDILAFGSIPIQEEISIPSLVR